MRSLTSVSRRSTLVGVLCAIVLAVSGCGGGSSYGGPSGGLLVAADFVTTTEAIYEVVVTEEFAPFTATTYTIPLPLWIDPTETLFIDDFFPGSYTVTVRWTDGVTFPTFIDTHVGVLIFDGVDWTEHFPS